MTTRVSDIIKQAYSLSQARDPNEELGPSEAAQGLDTLNAIINEWGNLSIFIPSFNTITVDILQNVYKYVTSPIIVDIMNANLLDSSNVLSVLTFDNLKKLNVSNFLNFAARPDTVMLTPNQDDLQNSCLLYFYPTPNADYTSTLQIKRIIDEMTQSEVLDFVPKFYFKAMIYQLAFELHITYATILPDGFMKVYTDTMRRLQATAKRDLSVKNGNPYVGSRYYRPGNNYV